MIMTFDLIIINFWSLIITFCSIIDFSSHNYDIYLVTDILHHYYYRISKVFTTLTGSIYDVFLGYSTTERI